MTDEITRHRMDAGNWDYHIDLEIRGVRLGNSGRVRWSIVQTDADKEYNDQYLADVLEKVIEAIRGDDADDTSKAR